MSSSGLSAAKRRRGVVHDKPPTFQTQKQEPKKMPTANELLLLHEICIRELNSKMEKMENEIKELKEKYENK